MEWSISLYMTILSIKNPIMLKMIKNAADFNKVMLELSKVTGLSVTACVDIVINTCEGTGYSWEVVANKLKRESLKRPKTHG